MVTYVDVMGGADLILWLLYDPNGMLFALARIRQRSASGFDWVVAGLFALN